MTYFCLELEGAAHELEFGNVRLQQAVVSEDLKGQPTALFCRCVLLLYVLVLLLLDTIVLDEVMESHSGLGLLQCRRRTFRPALSLKVHIKAT